MGSMTVCRTYPKYPRDILEEIIAGDRREDSCEYGCDTYSGYWGSKENGVSFFAKTTNSLKEAESFVCENSGKGDRVAAVIVSVGADNRIDGGNGWELSLAEKKPKTDKSHEVLEKKRMLLVSLKEERKERLTGYLAKRVASRNTVTCWKCKKLTKTEDVTVSKSCPDCGAKQFYLSGTEYKSVNILNQKIDTLAKDIAKREADIEKKTTAKVDALEKKIAKLENNRRDAIRKASQSIKKSGFVTCKNCQSKINLGKLSVNWSAENKVVDYTECPVCFWSGLQGKSSETHKDKASGLKFDLIPLYKELSLLTGEWYVVGGVCRC